MTEVNVEDLLAEQFEESDEQEVESTEEEVELDEAQTETDESDDYDYETEASENGWTPQDQWRGDPEEWVDAKTFVERGKTILPIVNAQNRRLKSKVDELEEAVRIITKDREEIRKNEYERALAKMKAERREAMNGFDFDKAEEISEKIEELQSKKVEKEEEPPKVDPKINSWMQENNWYAEDEEMRADADAFAIAFRQKNPKADGVEMLDYVKKRIVRAYPDKFERKKKSPSVESSVSSSRKTSQDDGFSSLPDEAKSAFKQLARLGAYEDSPKGRAAYAKAYNS